MSKTPALMVRVKAVRSKSGDLIRAGSVQRQLHRADAGREADYLGFELEDADTRGEKPRITVDGYNLAGTAQRKESSLRATRSRLSRSHLASLAPAS